MVTFLFSLFLFTSSSFAKDQGFVHHPAPKEPFYLKSSMYDIFKRQIPIPPTLGSASQQSDEKELLQLQSSRSEADCAKAKEEVFVSLKSFYGTPHGSLKEKEIKVLSDFFEQIRNDGDYFIQRMKKDFPRQRPFAYIKGINPCVSKEVTGAYPSGHAVLSKLYASILSDFFPSDKETFEKRALVIGKHRVLTGMHHPTDIESGRKLADLIYGELKKSKAYQDKVKALSLLL